MLKRVKIQGYKSLVDVEVNLQPLSVLFGINATGKSNFLDALQLLSRIATSRELREAFEPPYRGAPLESFTFGPRGIKDLLLQEKASFTIEVDIEISQPTIDRANYKAQLIGGPETTGFAHEKYLRYRIEIEILPKTGFLSVVYEYLAALNANGELITQPPLLEKSSSALRLKGREQSPLSKLDQSIFSMPPYLARFSYLLVLREELASWFFYYLEPREHMRILYHVKEIRHIGPRGEELTTVLNTLRTLNEPQFRAVEKALHMIIPSITGIDVEVNNSGEVELSLMEGNIPIPARVVSEGTLRILGLLALSGAKDQTSLFCFEEPENGVHPRRIRLIASILETLASDSTQVIVTTHSPVLPDVVSSKSLYVCRKINSRTEIDPFSKWEYTNVNTSSSDEDNYYTVPKLTISERILRGDFDEED